MADKVIQLSELGRFVHDGDAVALGGYAFRRHPMGLVYEVIRQRRKNLTLMGWNNGNDMDILIGAGCAVRVETSYVGMVMYGLAQNFRRAVQDGRVRSMEYTEATAYDRFRAGKMGISFIPAKGLHGSDILRVNADIKEVTCPFTGERYAAIPAAHPDVTLFHAHYADANGNILVSAKRVMENEADITMAKAAKRVVVSVEKIVDNEFVKRNSFMTALPGFYVDAVVELPFGAYPCSNDYFYDVDSEHLRMYAEASRSDEAMQKYLEEYVYGVPDHAAFLDKALTPTRVMQLQKGVTNYA